MRNTVLQYLTRIGSASDKASWQEILSYLANSLNTVALNSAGLVIKAGTSTLAKTGSSDFYATVKGILVKIAASTDMPALTGLTITANNFNVAVFFVDAAGTTSVAFGTQAATIGAVKWPDFPIDKVCVGALLITHSATFTGGTTALDTATTVYLSPVGGFDPTFLYS